MRTITPELQAAINKAAQTAALREKTSAKIRGFFKKTTTLTVKAVVIPTSFVVGLPRLFDTDKTVRNAVAQGWETGQKPYTTLEEKVQTISAAEADFLQTAREGNFTDFLFKSEEDLLAGLRKLGVKDKDFVEVRDMLMGNTVANLEEKAVATRQEPSKVLLAPAS